MPAVLLFDNDEELHVFASVPEAERWLEAISVVQGTYDAAYLHDGTVLQLVVLDDRVEALPTKLLDLDGLKERLALYQRMWPKVPQEPEPLDYVNARFRWEWENRWPQHPRWLDRLLHRRGQVVVRD